MERSSVICWEVRCCSYGSEPTVGNCFLSYRGTRANKLRAWKLHGKETIPVSCAVQVESKRHRRSRAWYVSYSRRIRRTTRRTTSRCSASCHRVMWAWCPSYDTASTCSIYGKRMDYGSTEINLHDLYSIAPPRQPRRMHWAYFWIKNSAMERKQIDYRR